MATQKEKRAQFRERQITDFAILEASEQAKDQDKDQDAEKLKFSRVVIAKMLNVGQSTLNRWESEAAFIDTMNKAGGKFSRIRIVFELYALATAQGREIAVDLQKQKEDRKIAWEPRFRRWKKKGGTFKDRVEFYKSLPDSDRAKEEDFWTDRFNNKSAAVEIDVKTEVPNIQIRYAIDEILLLLKTPEELDTFFGAVEHRQVANEEDVRKTVIKGARRSQMRTVELIEALEARVPARTAT